MSQFINLSTFVLVFGLVGNASAQDFPAAEEVTYTADNCVDGQDLSSPGLDTSNCPEIPSNPQSATINLGNNQATTTSLGGWEMEVTKEGKSYHISSMNSPEESPRIWHGSEAADEKNFQCWTEGYYGLRAMLKNPPAEYIKLRDAGYQTEFFQYQVDRRVGATGFATGVRSYEDYLVKWVTIVEADGTCNPTTLDEFRDYAKRELILREID